jgi:hypothetical protein
VKQIIQLARIHLLHEPLGLVVMASVVRVVAILPAPVLPNEGS